MSERELWVNEYTEEGRWLPHTDVDVTEFDAEGLCERLRELTVNDVGEWPEGTQFRVVRYAPLPSVERVERVVEEAVKHKATAWALNPLMPDERLTEACVRHAIQAITGEE